MRDQILKRQEGHVNDILKNASVSILGCGGLGSNIAMTLARVGVGNIYIYDFDTVEHSNLNRQNYNVSDLGKSKVLKTKEKIKEAIPYAKVYGEEVFITWDVLDDISKRTDIFIEAFDKKEMKKLAFDYFLGKQGKRLVMASGVSGLGDLDDIKIKNIDNVTMIGNFTTTPDEGLYSPFIGIISNLEALSAVKIIVGEEDGK